MLLSLLCLVGHEAFAQGEAFKKNFFSAWHLSGFSEGGSTAPMTLQMYDYQTDDYYTTKGHITYFNFIGVVYEPRFNLLNFGDRASVDVSAPLSGRINVSLDDDDILAVGGLGAYADFNIGNRATYNNIDGNGYSLGLGMDVDKYFSSGIEGLVYSPMVRVKVISLINSIYDAYFAVMLKAGIPVTYEDEAGATQVGNQNFGLYLSLGF